MSVQIRLLRPSEMPYHVFLVRTSFYEADDSNNRIVYPKGPTAALLTWHITRFTKVLTDSDPDTNIFLGAFPLPTDPAATPSDPEGKDMLSTAYWRIESPETYMAELDDWTPTIPQGPFPELPPSDPHLPMDSARPPDSNPTAINYFTKRIDVMRQTAMRRDETYYHLCLLATLPTRWRRGAGRALVMWALERADREGRRTYLDATEMGRPFYERLGFRVVDVVSMRAEEWEDASGRVGYTYGMVREVGGGTVVNGAE